VEYAYPYDLKHTVDEAARMFLEAYQARRRPRAKHLPTESPGTNRKREKRALPHLHQDWAHPAHICAGTGLTPTHICTGTAAHPAHICTGTGPALATSALTSRKTKSPNATRLLGRRPTHSARRSLARHPVSAAGIPRSTWRSGGACGRDVEVVRAHGGGA
jgi:hypothetical protein